MAECSPHTTIGMYADIFIEGGGGGGGGERIFRLYYGLTQHYNTYLVWRRPKYY